MRQVLGALDREPAVDVDGALRPSGRARGVDEHVRRLGVGRLRPRRLAVAGRPAGASARSAVSCHQASRPSTHGVEIASPARRTTTTRRTDGTAATASSATAFSGTHDPRRRKPSAVISIDASQSASRAAMAGAATRRRSACRSPGARPRARTATTVSTSIGSRIADPVAGADAERVQVVVAARRPRPASSRVGQHADRAVLALPGERRTVRVPRDPRLEGRPRVVELGRRPTSAPRPVPGWRRGPWRGGRAQAIPISSAAAPQNHAGSATARACRASSDGSPVDRRNRARYESLRSSAVGRHATPSPSRPKIGQSAGSTIGIRR